LSVQAQDDRGHLALVLHAHLPFVRHPECPDFLEENWLYEAITETYIPLLAMAERWHEDRIPARVTLSVSPPLVEMLRDELLVSRYLNRTRLLLELAESEVRRNVHDERFRYTAEMYRDRFADALDRFDRRYDRDLVARFAAMQDAGIFEIATSSATHAFLPCFDRTQARAQIRVGVKTYQRHFGRMPRGMWLPECGFVPGLDRVLANEALNYFVVDSHAVEFASPAPMFGTSAPLVCPSGLLAFPRDRQSSAQVWSAEGGYPGDGRYREFYRDVGHDLPDDDPAIAPFRRPGCGRQNVGIKYHRITDRNVALHDKQPYHRGWALEAADQHAAHFVSDRVRQVEFLRSRWRRPPVIVAPYDAELFGHWWFEGLEFLDLVIRKAAYDQSAYRLSTLSDIADSELEFQVAMPAASSWGAYGYSDTWLNQKNDWMWPHLHHAAREIARVAEQRPSTNAIERCALNQLAREFVLASSSDWAFIVTMGTMNEYAEQRFRDHICRFNDLLDQILANRIDPEILADLEHRDNIFPDIDYRDFGGSASAV
jgi:1,4-alpha-glucan branching enzyme